VKCDYAGDVIVSKSLCRCDGQACITADDSLTVACDCVVVSSAGERQVYDRSYQSSGAVAQVSRTP